MRGAGQPPCTTAVASFPHPIPSIPAPILSFPHSIPSIPAPILSFPHPILSFPHPSCHSRTHPVIPAPILSFPRRRESSTLRPARVYHDTTHAIGKRNLKRGSLL